MRNFNIYFIHANWLKDREKVISEFRKQVTKYKFNKISDVKVSIITDYDPNDIDNAFIKNHISYAPYTEPELAPFNQLIKPLHVYHVSNSMKHVKALQLIAANTNPDDINLILEDDIVYEDRVCMLLEKVINTLPDDSDLVFLGLPTNMQIKNRNQIIYKKTEELFNLIPYSDSYIVTQKAAKKMLSYLQPVKLLFNVQLSVAINTLKLQSYQTVPNVFMDGSKYGVFVSTLTPNNALIFHGDYTGTRNTLQQDQLSDQDHEKLKKLFETSPIRQHPDFQYLKAQYYIKTGEYKEAEGVYNSALTVYQNNGCFLNHESQFLKDFLKLYKHLQDKN